MRRNSTGSTGTAKGVAHSQAVWVGHCPAFQMYFERDVFEGVYWTPADWGSFRIRETVHDRPPGEYDPDPDGEPEDGVYRYASAWIRDDDRVLFVRPVGEDAWINPGGTHEPGERYEDTARREVREETGLDCRLTGVLEARVAIDRFGDRAAVPSMGVAFRADRVGGELRPEPGEIAAVRWFEDHPDELAFDWIEEYPI